MRHNTLALPLLVSSPRHRTIAAGALVVVLLGALVGNSVCTGAVL